MFIWKIALKNLQELEEVKVFVVLYYKTQKFQATGIHFFDQNKIELFKFLAFETSQLQTDRLVIATYDKSVLSNQKIDQSILAPCHQEEADTRMFLHAVDASNAERWILIRLLLVRFNFHDLSKININCIMVLYYYCFI